jgi:hypothetical protein
MNVEGNKEGLELRGAPQLLAYAANFIGRKINYPKVKYTPFYYMLIRRLI